MKDTKIAWSTHTFNPWLGCVRVSPGCERCYAEAFVVERMKLPVWGPSSTTKRKRTSASTWKQPLAWNRKAAREGARARVFCASLADVFEDNAEVLPWRCELFALIESTPNLDWQLLTKRPQNIARMLPASWLDKPRANVWLGTTVEDQQRADERIPHLLRVPAAVRFLSVEPMLGPVLLPVRAVTRACETCKAAWFKGGPAAGEACPATPPESTGCTGRVRTGIDWCIVGGESGPDARPCDVAWIRSIVAQCREAGVAAFCKQLDGVLSRFSAAR